jgi:hypothetical protein
MKITDVEAIYVRLPEVKEQISPSADGRSRDCGISMTGSNFFTRSYALGYVISPRGAVHARNVSLTPARKDSMIVPRANPALRLKLPLGGET